MLDTKFSFLIQKAGELAYKNAHEYVTCQHVLYTLIRTDDDIRTLLLNAGISNLDSLTKNLENYIATTPVLKSQRQPSVTQHLSTIIKNANLEENKDNIYGSRNFILDIIKDKNLGMSELLVHHGANLNLIEDMINTKNTQKDNSNISLYAINLNELAKDGKIDPLIRRDNELARMVQILSRRKKNNPILVGEAGVGKTAIVEGLALNIVNGNVTEKLKNSTIYALDIGAMISGTKYRGDFEKRLKDTINEIEQIEGAIVFIDEIHTIVGAGASGGGSLDMSNLLKPSLASGKIRCIGATTYCEYRNFTKDKALSRRFSKIDINEPSIEDSVEILNGIKKYYEDFHGVSYPKEILKQSVILAKKYMSDKFLPDSAVDIIDEVGATLNLTGKKIVTKKALNEIISKATGIANLNTSENQTDLIKNLKQNLKKQIFGQDEAIDALVKAINRSYAGLKNPNSPTGVFLFTGPSGVGKSELAITLAKELNIHFERFDMSEYMEKHSVAKLIGSPPGYVGFEEGGILTNAIKKNPYSVVLFDEVEKADSDMLNIFLQIFDNGVLSDSSGNKADFKNTIIIMTSNLGTKEPNQMGFKKDDSIKTTSAIKNFFAPEFRNRIDKIINFAHLNDEILDNIVLKELNLISQTLKDKNVVIKADKKAREFIYKKGYSQEFGARNIKRAISEEILDILSEEILFGKLKSGGNAVITLKNENLSFKFN
ncbi:ATP-dependent Clp protease, ATP-binding subunit [Campylobacter sputorum bv. paraureolyticus LMG 11764]|uniref:AAA family ATPase n=1 Tax=Campylobacter sputorum TaxID=206 RepID=UPI000B78BD77|nr:AAA family ATPase [Campylobacter sputorum]ASM38397.1 ATP-dependent Clp protease, ATP-binding subunit [Campylobacter sputorum bv. paraureolyticus LMG 11764]